MVIENMKYKSYDAPYLILVLKSTFFKSSTGSASTFIQSQNVCFAKKYQNWYCSNEKHPNDFFSNKIVAVLKFNWFRPKKVRKSWPKHNKSALTSQLQGGIARVFLSLFVPTTYTNYSLAELRCCAQLQNVVSVSHQMSRSADRHANTYNKSFKTLNQAPT